MIVVHAEAVREARAARRSYSDRNPATGLRFLGEFERALLLVAESPNRWPEHPGYKSYRCFRFRRFPFSLIYEISGPDVFVLAVAHDRRLPGYWRNRLH